MINVYIVYAIDGIELEHGEVIAAFFDEDKAEKFVTDMLVEKNMNVTNYTLDRHIREVCISDSIGLTLAGSRHTPEHEYDRWL